MSAELARQDGAAVAVQPQSDLMAVIARAAADENVNVDKMERLFALKERMDGQERQRLFAEALARIQADAPRITQHGKTDKAKFAKLEDIDFAMRPLMAGEGFSLSFDTEMVDGKVLMVGKLSHRAGHSEEKRLALPIDNGPGRNSIQAMGSTVSYGRRYLTKMFFNIIEVGEDNDGNGAPGKTITQNQADQLNDLITEIGGDARDKILAWAKVGKIADLPAAKFDGAMSALLKRRAQ